mmetsp:Transcript_73826/g.205299  ORF Transcript_73826/g.205299 Transcript_73826/m.205299 type:complete len:180 (+) Transcript_73826:2024-2563(+)
MPSATLGRAASLCGASTEDSALRFRSFRARGAGGRTIASAARGAYDGDAESSLSAGVARLNAGCAGGADASGDGGDTTAAMAPSATSSRGARLSRASASSDEVGDTDGLGIGIRVRERHATFVGRCVSAFTAAGGSCDGKRGDGTAGRISFCIERQRLGGDDLAGSFVCGGCEMGGMFV